MNNYVDRKVKDCENNVDDRQEIKRNHFKNQNIE